MVTDDERRRVAEGLRDVARTEGGPLGDIGFTEAMHRALGGGGWRDMTERLADLIDPDTATDTTKPGPDTTKAPTSSDTAPTRTDATATCDMSPSRRDAVACDPTESGIDSIYDWRTRLAEPLRVDLPRLRSIAEGLRTLGEREVLSSGAAHEVGEDILGAIGEESEEADR